MKKTILSLLAATILFSSCATVFSGSRQTVTFTSSTPSTVYVKNLPIGTTPISAKVKRKTKVVEFRAEGYETSVVKVDTKVNPWYFANFVGLIAFGAGGIGIGVDCISGAIWKLPTTINADIKKK